MKLFHVFIGAVVAVVIAVIGAGLWFSGSPVAERARRLDAARVSSLQSISQAIDQYYTTNKRLPTDLDTLTKARDMYYVTSIVDPETNETYAYQTRSTDGYELCATFVTDTRGQDPRKGEPYAAPESRFWEHGAERTCFTITARDFQKP